MTQLQDNPVTVDPYASVRHVDVAKVGGAIGAVVSGIRVDGEVAPAEIAELRAALLRHKVVFLRDQHHATDSDQLAFTQLLGPVTKPHPTVEFRHLEFETEHPVVRIHPETGEPSLLLGHFVRSFAGLSSVDSAELFGLLQRHITRLENTVRWTWREGDIAIWDNRATQRYAVADYDDLPRLMHRITVAGDIPVGISGETSTVRKGDASSYSSNPAA